MLVNIAVLLLCLIAILLFKRVVADRTADFMQEYAPDAGEASEGTSQALHLDLSIQVAQGLVHQAANRAYERQ